MLMCVCVLLVQQVSVYSVTMSKWIKRGNYNHEYHHKQSQYVVKEYSRYIVKLPYVLKYYDANCSVVTVVSFVISKHAVHHIS